MSCLTAASTAVREMSGILLKNQGSVGEKILSGKRGLKLFIVSCILASIRDFAELVHFILVSYHALLHSYPTTDNNTSTSVIWLTLKIGRGTMNHQRNVMELSGISDCLESGHPASKVLNLACTSAVTNTMPEYEYKINYIPFSFRLLILCCEVSRLYKGTLGHFIFCCDQSFRPWSETDKPV